MHDDAIECAPRALLDESRIYLFVVSKRGTIWRFAFAPQFVGARLASCSVLAQYSLTLCSPHTQLDAVASPIARFAIVDSRTVALCTRRSSRGGAVLLLCTRIGANASGDSQTELSLGESFWGDTVAKAELEAAPAPASVVASLTSRIGQFARTGFNFFKRYVRFRFSSELYIVLIVSLTRALALRV